MSKKTKTTAISLLFFAVLALAFVFFREEGITMKGSEDPVSRTLREESFYQRYGVSPQNLILWLDQSDVRSYGDVSNWYDLSGNNNHGTQTTAANQPMIDSTSAVAGAVRKFDGDDYVNIVGEGDDFSTSQFSVVIWALRGTDTGDIEILIDNRDAGGDGWIVGVDNGDDLSCAFNLVSAGIIVHNMSLNVWQFLACSSDGSTIRAFVNGTEVDATDVSGAGSISETTNARIGARAYSGLAYYWWGQIAEIQIFKRSLTNAEIERLYKTSKVRYGGL